MTSGHDLHKRFVQALLVALLLLCSAAAVLGEERRGDEPVAVSTVGRAFLPYVFVAGSSEPLSPLPLPVHVLTVDKTKGGMVNSEPAGIECGNVCFGEFTWGSIIALTAEPDPFYLFGGWEGACRTKNLTCELFVSSSTPVTVTFIPVSHEIAIAKAGDGAGTVTSQPAGIDCGDDCLTRYDHGTPITLTATAAISSTFSGWSGACTGTDSVCQITADAAKTVTATFAVRRHVLIVNNSGEGSGSVTSQPAGIACGNDCVETYAHGTLVTLQAAVSTDTDFRGWSGACSGTEFTCQVTMDAAKVVTAMFAKASYPLSVEKTGDGDGRIISVPAGVDCGDDCGESIVHGTVVTLTAAPAAGGVFIAWDGACSGPSRCVITMDGPRQVTGIFSQAFESQVRVGGNMQVGETVVLTASLGLSDVDSCIWDFADGSTEPCEQGLYGAGGTAQDAVQVFTTHVFTEAGIYDVTVAASNVAGAVKATLAVTIADVPPIDYSAYIPLIMR